MDKLRNILAEFCANGNHLFWPDSVSVLDNAHFDLAGAGPKSLTDLYLPAVVTAHSGRLVTFDRGVGWKCVVAAGPDALEAIT